MSNVEGEDREFGDLGLPPDEFGPPEPADETLGPEGAGDMPESADGLLEPAGEGQETEDLVDPLQPTEGDPLADLGSTAPDDLGDLTDEGLVEEEAEEEETEKPPTFLQKLAKTSPFVVLLGISLLAIVIACLCMFLELKRYGGQLKPPQATMAPAVQPGTPNTVATA